jgi:hypothetical protein
MKIIALTSVTFILLTGCIRSTPNAKDKIRIFRNTHVNTRLPSSRKDYANVTRKDTTITFLLNKKWKSYHPDTLSADFEEYSYLLQRKIWNSTYLVLHVLINDVIAIDSKNSLMICYDNYSYKNFEVKLPTSELDKILQIDSSYVNAFLLVKNFDFDFKLNPRIIDDSDLKYDLIIKCELIDMFLELKKERD